MQHVLRLARSATSLLTAGKLAMAVSQGLILVIVARLEGASGVGLYTLALAVVSPTFLFAHLRLQDVIATDVDTSVRWPVHVRVAGLSAVLGVLVAAGIGIAWGGALWAVVLPLACAKAIESLVFVCQGNWQANGQFALVAKSNIIRAGLAVIGMGIGTYFGGIPGGALGMAVAWAIMLVIVEVPRVPGPGSRVTLSTIRSRWWSLLPLGFVAMLLSLNQHIVRLAIDIQVGTRELGIFAATAYLVRAGTIVAQSLSQAGGPALRRAGQSGDKFASGRVALRSGIWAGTMGIVLFVGIVVVGPMVIPALFGTEFEPSRGLLTLVGLAGVPLFVSTSLALSTVATGQHRSYLILVAISLIVTAVAVVFLTPRWGVNGAAAGWAIGEFVKLGLMMINLRLWASSGPQSADSKHDRRRIDE